MERVQQKVEKGNERNLILAKKDNLIRMSFFVYKDYLLKHFELELNDYLAALLIDPH